MRDLSPNAQFPGQQRYCDEPSSSQASVGVTELEMKEPLILPRKYERCVREQFRERKREIGYVYVQYIDIFCVISK